MIVVVRSVLTIFISILIFVTMPAPTAAAQASLRILVTDPQGAAVAGGRVTLTTRNANLRQTAVTDRSGVATFDPIAPGEYLVEVDAEGFTRPPPTHVTVRPGTPTEITRVLSVAGVSDFVVVTASGTAQSLAQLSKTAQVVDRAEMEARDDRTIADALRAVPGVRIQQLGGPGAAMSINVRGLRAEDTAVLIDGVRFRDAAATQGDAGTFLSDLLITSADRVEVLRGSGSSLYGSHAIGGVVNLITRRRGGPAGGAFLIEGGGLGTATGSGRFGGSLSNNRVTYEAGLTRLSVSSGVDGDDEAENTSGQVSLGFAFSASAHASARFVGADAATMINEGPSAIGALPPVGIVPARSLSLVQLARYESGTPIAQLEIGDATFLPSANDPDNRRTSNSRSTLVTLSHQATSRVGYTAAFHDVRTARRFDDGPLGVSGFEPSQPTRSEFEGRIQTLVSRTHVQLGSRNLVTAAYEFEREQYVNRSSATSVVSASTADVVERSHSGFVQNQFSPTGALEISGAFRFQRFALATPRFTPPDRAPYGALTFRAPPDAHVGDASVAYAWSADTRFRAHAGTGYRAPSLFERFGTSFGRRGYSIYGDPRLAPEQSVAVDAGVDRDVARARIRVSVIGFSTWLRDVIVFDFSGAISPASDPFGRSSGYRTIERMTSRGVELQAAGTLTPNTRVDGAYTYAHAAPRAGAPPEANQASGIPRHQVTLSLVQRVGTPLQLSIDTTLSSAHLATLADPVTFSGRAFRFTGMRRVNVAAVYVRPLVSRVRLRLFGRIDDLLESTTYESGFRTPGRWATAGAGVEF